MLNAGNPEEAFSQSFLPNDGVGLAREEFIITTYVKIHPLALLDYEELADLEVRRQIDEITAGYEDKPQFYVDKLAEGIAMDSTGTVECVAVASPRLVLAQSLWIAICLLHLTPRRTCTWF